MTSRLAILIAASVAIGSSSAAGADRKSSAPPAQANAPDKAGREAQAEQALRKAIAAGADSAEIHGELGLLLYRTGRFHEAIPELGRAAQLDPVSPEYSLKLAASILAERRYSVALDFLRAIAPKFENRAEYQYNLGLAHYGLRGYESALVAFLRAAQLAPNMDLAHFFVANSYVANADLTTAIPYYRKALALNPKRVGYYYALGKTLGELGPAHRQEAMSLLRTALKLKPDDTASKFGLAILCESTGNVRCAQPLLESVIARYPGEIAPRVVLGRIYTKLGEPQKARLQFEAVRRIEDSRNGRTADSELDPAASAKSTPPP